MDKTLILDPREALIYPFPFGDWTTIRVGFFYSLTANTGDGNVITFPNGANGLSTVDVLSPRDRMYFGIKSANETFPGEGEPYAGLVCFNDQTKVSAEWNGSSFINSRFQAFNPNTAYGFGAVQANDTKSYVANGDAGIPMPHVSTMIDSTAYAGFYAFTFQILNKGTASQQITVSKYTIGANGVTDTSNDNLKALMLSQPYVSTATVDFNLSGVPYSLPDAVFLYLPFGNVRLRIHSVGAVRID